MSAICEISKNIYDNIAFLAFKTLYKLQMWPKILKKASAYILFRGDFRQIYNSIFRPRLILMFVAELWSPKTMQFYKNLYVIILLRQTRDKYLFRIFSLYMLAAKCICHYSEIRLNRFNRDRSQPKTFPINQTARLSELHFMY